MAKVLFGVGAFAICCSLGAVAVGSGIQQEPDRMSLNVTADVQTEAITLQQMSPEEKERRREECATLYTACYDWCGKSTKPNTSTRDKCREECSKKNTECMKKIPNDYPPQEEE
jgi:hypothetical protein